MQLTVRDAARLLQVSEKSIYRWIENAGLPAYRVNRQYRFSRAELLEWATARRIRFTPEIFAEEPGSVALPGLVEALQAGGIHYRVGGTDRESALRAIVETMPLPDEVDREFLLQVLVARESLGSTGVGNGIAIPHARNPIVLHVSRPLISLCFLERPIDFGALDGEPVHTLFSLVSPTVRAHLHLLSRLAHALRDPGFAGVILRQGSRAEIQEEAQRVEAAMRQAQGAPQSEARR